MIQPLDEAKKEILIHKLIVLGIYKKGKKQLFELSLCDLEMELKKVNVDSRREEKYEKAVND